jgi:DNA-binding XRE family transcriptional regulator/mannose-6-phosphate isomerase-like protein (cupin superfamily)
VERATATDGSGERAASDETTSDGREPEETGPATLGQRLRSERTRQHVGLRELSRRVGVSPSMISQIELGRATPSVSTLYSIVQQLNMSLDQLFSETADANAGSMHGRVQAQPQVGHSRGAATTGQPRSSEGPVVRAGSRHAIHLGSGVTWESMSPDTGYGVDFLYATYDVGGESAPEDALIRHGGREYGHVLEGRLGVTVGFASYVLEPGDSISFDSTTPHRLFNAGDQPAKAIWCVIGREDPRGARNTSAVAPVG